MKVFRFMVKLVQTNLEEAPQASRHFSLQESSLSLQAMESLTNIHGKF